MATLPEKRVNFKPKLHISHTGGELSESVNNFVYFWKSFFVWNAYLNKYGIQGILASSKSTMCSFFELRKVHEANDKAVLQAYGLKPSSSEAEIVQYLFKMYEMLTAKTDK